MKFIFVLGRNPELSLLELESYLEARKIEYKIVSQSKDILVIELSKLIPIEDLGGIIKIALVVSETSDVEEIEYCLDKVKIYEGSKNKVNYYVTCFNSRLKDFVRSYLKDYFKREGLKAYFKSSDSPSDLIKKEGIEFILYKDLVAKTVAISNPLDLKERDIGRPSIDFVSAISLRLGKIMINMSGVKPGEKLLDPFCGSGSILQEALLLGVDCVGVDADKAMIKKSKDNLDWLKKKYIVKAKFDLFKMDCRELSKKVSSVNAVVSEPYMGPFLKRLPKRSEVFRIIKDLKGIYAGLFSELRKVLKKNGKVVIIMPTFKTQSGQMIGVNLGRLLEGFEVIERVLYKSPKSKLTRHIFIIRKV